MGQQSRYRGGIILGPNRSSTISNNTGVIGRVSTSTEAGAALAIPASYSYGEGFELRYDVSFTASQFQGVFCRVAAASGVANTSTIGGAEFDARNASAQNAGTLRGVHGTATVRGAATVTGAYGISGNVSSDADVAATVTELAAVRAKVQVEDAATYTKGYCVLADHENVTGNKTITAAYGAKSGAGEAFTSLIDCQDATLAETNSGKNVTLITFKGANGTLYHLVHDTDAATAVSVTT